MERERIEKQKVENTQQKKKVQNLRNFAEFSLRFDACVNEPEVLSLRFVSANGVSDGYNLTVCESGSGCWAWAVWFRSCGRGSSWDLGRRIERIFVNILLGLATWGDSAGASVTVTLQHDHNSVINSVML